MRKMFMFVGLVCDSEDDFSFEWEEISLFDK